MKRLEKYVGNRTTIQGTSQFQATDAQEHRHVSISITEGHAQNFSVYKAGLRSLSGIRFSLQKWILAQGSELAVLLSVKKLFLNTFISLVYNLYIKCL